MRYLLTNCCLCQRVSWLTLPLNYSVPSRDLQQHCPLRYNEMSVAIRIDTLFLYGFEENCIIWLTDSISWESEKVCVCEREREREKIRCLYLISWHLTFTQYFYLNVFQTASMSEALEARRREVMAGQEAWRSGGRDAPTGQCQYKFLCVFLCRAQPMSQ